MTKETRKRLDEIVDELQALAKQSGDRFLLVEIGSQKWPQSTDWAKTAEDLGDRMEAAFKDTPLICEIKMRHPDVTVAVEEAGGLP